MLFNIKNLEYNFKKHKILSKKISFKLNKSNHLLILGPSGCGKTTLLNLMAGLLRASNGLIEFEDNDYSLLTNNEIDEIRAHNFGFIFQKLHLINHLNVEQNIILAKNKKDSQNIYSLIDQLGLSMIKKQVIGNLSFGEAQRVAIARALVNNPKVIFADEPTSALDELNTKKVIELLFAQAKKTYATLIVSSHDYRIKKYFSNILEM